MSHYYNKILVAIAGIVSFFSASAQVTPGVIIRECTDATTGRTILNPTYNSVFKSFGGKTYRYGSATNAGWVTNGNDTSWAVNAIRWRPVPSPCGEPCCDLRRGPDHRFSDIVYDAQGVGVYMYYDSTNQAVLFRFRMGDLIPGAKGYSLLLDTDLRWGATGASADAGYVAKTTGINGNPGYELEIVLETGFGVAVYNVDGVGNPSDRIQQTRRIWYSGSNLTPAKNWTDMSQVVLAATNEDGDPDYFLEFYLPASVLTGSGFFPNGINQPIRIVPTTVMAPKPSTAGPISDIYGCDDSTTTAWQPPICIGCNVISGICTPAPTLNSISLTSPSATTAQVSGTWTPDPKGSRSATIFIFRNNDTTTAIASVQVTSTNGGQVNWGPLNITGAAAGQIITAKARGTHAYESRWCFTSNARTITNCSGVVPMATLDCITNKGANGSNFFWGTGATAASTIILQRNTGTGGFVNVAQYPGTANTEWAFTGTGSFRNWSFNGSCANNGNSKLDAGAYSVIVRDANGCTSGYSFSCNTTGTGNTGSSATRALTWTVPTTLTTTTTTISGGFAAGTEALPSVVQVFRDSVLLGNATLTGSPVTAWSFNLGNYTLSNGQEIMVRWVASDIGTGNNATRHCASVLRRTIATQPCVNRTPVVNVDSSASFRLVPGQTITGLANAGDTVRLYNASNVLRATVVANSGGVWNSGYVALSPSATPNDGTRYYVTARSASCANLATSANYDINTSNTPDKYCGGSLSFSVDASAGNGTFTPVLNSSGQEVGTLTSDAKYISGTFPSGVTTPAGSGTQARIVVYLNGTEIMYQDLSGGVSSWGPINVSNLLFQGAELTVSLIEIGKAEYLCATYVIKCACATTNVPLAPVIGNSSKLSVESNQKARVVITNPRNNHYYRLYSRTTGEAMSDGLWYDSTMGSPIVGGRMLSGTDSLTIFSYVISQSDMVDVKALAISTESCENTTARQITFLPIELLDFRGRRVGKTHQLNWRSGEEVNAAFYLVERSTDGVRFSRIGLVQTAGSNSTYQFVDEQPASGENYYRLKMVDFDSRFKYSPVILLRGNSEQSLTLNKVRPNPFTDRIQMSIHLTNAGPVELQLIDGGGRIVAGQTQAGVRGVNDLQLAALPSLPAGIYTLRVVADGRIYREKLVCAGR